MHGLSGLDALEHLLFQTHRHGVADDSVVRVDEIRVDAPGLVDTPQRLGRDLHARAIRTRNHVALCGGHCSVHGRSSGCTGVCVCTRTQITTGLSVPRVRVRVGGKRGPYVELEKPVENVRPELLGLHVGLPLPSCPAGGRPPCGAEVKMRRRWIQGAEPHTHTHTHTHLSLSRTQTHAHTAHARIYTSVCTLSQTTLPPGKGRKRARGLGSNSRNVLMPSGLCRSHRSKTHRDRAHHPPPPPFPPSQPRKHPKRQPKPSNRSFTYVKDTMDDGPFDVSHFSFIAIFVGVRDFAAGLLRGGRGGIHTVTFWSTLPRAPRLPTCRSWP